jgi:hypothetical protein
MQFTLFSNTPHMYVYCLHEKQLTMPSLKACTGPPDKVSQVKLLSKKANILKNLLKKCRDSR